MKFVIEYEIDNEVLDELSALLMLSKDEVTKLVESLLREGARRVNEYLRKLVNVIYNAPEDAREQVVGDVINLAISFGLEIGKTVEVKYRDEEGTD